MTQEKRKYLGKNVEKCLACGAEIVFMENPTTGKTPPVNLDSFHGERFFDSEIHVNHYHTCVAKVGKKGTGAKVVPERFKTQELKVVTPFEREFIDPRTGHPIMIPFEWGEMFRLSGDGKYYVGPRKYGMEVKVEWNRLVDEQGNLLERPAEFFFVASKTDRLQGELDGDGLKKEIKRQESFAI